MSRTTARRVAKEHLDRGDATGWFEALYQLHRSEPREIPWADHHSNPNLTDWLGRERPAPGKVCVVGCGLGDDARALEERGFEVTAFDISVTAIAMCCERYPESKVCWEAADLFALPEAWRASFRLVVSMNTLQVFRDLAIRQRAFASIRSLVAPGGALLIITRGRDESDPEGQMPWPLVRGELETREFQVIGFEDYLDDEDPPVRRFRVQYAAME